MPALFLQKLFLKISIFHNFLLTFIRIAYIIILVKEIRTPNKKQEATTMKYEMTMKRWTITIDTEANTISGDTYNMRAEIKDNFDVTWDKTAKVWRGENLEAQIEKFRAYLTRVYYLTALEEPDEIAEVEKIEKPAPVKRNVRVIDRFVDTKPCPYCHTYCYGDCSFNR